jgi:2-polyprenyl-3-methyl-5-hydroxy-6-metoxy-1,4-benzoquinol methylase
MMGIWDRYKQVYDGLWVQKVSLEPTRLKVIDVLRQYGTLEGELLDMSCGTGQLLSDIEAAIPSLSLEGVEPSALGQVATEKGHRVIVGTIEDMCLTKAYDILVCTHAFPYYVDPSHAMTQFSACLKPGGLLIIAHAHTENLYDRIILALVKLTTSKAIYPSANKIHGLLQKDFVYREQIQVNQWYIPSIILHVAHKKGDL